MKPSPFIEEQFGGPILPPPWWFWVALAVCVLLALSCIKW